MSPIALVLFYVVLAQASIASLKHNPFQPTSLYDFKSRGIVYQISGSQVAEISRNQALGHQKQEDKTTDLITNTIPIEEKEQETSNGGSVSAGHSIFHRIVASLADGGLVGVTGRMSKRSVEGREGQPETTHESFQHVVGAVVVDAGGITVAEVRAQPTTLGPSKNTTEVKLS